MTWNYRVVEQDDGLGGRVLKIHTAYYHAATDQSPNSISETPASPFGDDITELREVIGRMLDGALKPVLQYEDFDRLEFCGACHGS